MKIDSILTEIDSRTIDANSIKDIVLRRLYDDKIITNEQAEIYAEKWNVIIIKNSWFERWMKKFKKSENYSFKYVKFED